MNDLLSIDEVAAQVKVSRDTVLRAIKAGKLTAQKFGRQWRVKPEALTAYIARATQDALTPVAPVPVPVAPMNQKDWARAIVETARKVPRNSWFGSDLVYISSLWLVWTETYGEDLPSFKVRLLEAHRKGLLELAHADMPQTLDQNKLADSEIIYRMSKFVFIRVKKD